jgi:hypothetical protein
MDSSANKVTSTLRRGERGVNVSSWHSAAHIHVRLDLSFQGKPGLVVLILSLRVCPNSEVALIGEGHDRRKNRRAAKPILCDDVSALLSQFPAMCLMSKIIGVKANRVADIDRDQALSLVFVRLQHLVNARAHFVGFTNLEVHD